MKWYEKLKAARNFTGLSCRKVEKLTGISNAYINQIENGKIEDPSFFKVHKLLILYDLSHKDLLSYTKMDNIIDWLLSIDGKEEILDAQQKAEKACFELKQAMKIDPEILRKPFDI